MFIRTPATPDTLNYLRKSTVSRPAVKYSRLAEKGGSMSESMKKPRMTQEEEDEIETLTKGLVMRDKMKLPKIDREVEQQRPARLRPWFRERLKFHRDAVRNS